MLFSPIQLSGSNRPDALGDTTAPGFGRRFGRERMGRDPAAIAAQVNYLGQILRHVNPYTGVALKDEPAILFIEPVNEPWHHPEDLAGSIRYINALTKAVRATGCRKLVFYNVSQDFRMTDAIRRSRAQGVTFGWYPSGLNSSHELEGNSASHPHGGEWNQLDRGSPGRQQLERARAPARGLHHRPGRTASGGFSWRVELLGRACRRTGRPDRSRAARPPGARAAFPSVGSSGGHRTGQVRSRGRAGTPGVPIGSERAALRAE
jgi:hypothetical protein